MPEGGPKGPPFFDLLNLRHGYRPGPCPWSRGAGTAEEVLEERVVVRRPSNNEAGMASGGLLVRAAPLSLLAPRLSPTEISLPTRQGLRR